MPSIFHNKTEKKKPCKNTTNYEAYTDVGVEVLFDDDQCIMKLKL